MRSQETLEAASEGREWAFPILTLDLVRGFYDLMGLDAAFHDRIHAGLRAATVRTRQEFVQGLVNPHGQVARADFCQLAESELGRDASEHLSWWLQNVFEAQTQDHRDLERWTQVIIHCHRDRDELWSQLPLSQPLAAEAFGQFAVARNFREYYRRAEELDSQPLSDWDLHMHASQLYDFSEDQEGTGANPMTHVSLAIHAYQYLRFFAWLLRSLSPEQQTALRDKALEIAIAEDIAWFDKLVHPSAFAVGL
jgi:hypothetical protein